MTTLKQTEDDVFRYLNKRWRVGWSVSEVTKYYNGLSYRQSIDESADINKALGTNIALETESDYTHLKLPAWTVRGFIQKVYNSRVEIETRLSEAPISPEPNLTKKTKKSSKAFGWTPINDNNSPITFDDGDEFLDNIASSQMEAKE